ncbi:hypothetical protein [uncultured Fibrobacter sp.]|nr:hypothetical protein [uncultured Fibrobacter sp.]
MRQIIKLLLNVDKKIPANLYATARLKHEAINVNCKKYSVRKMRRVAL